MAVKTTQLKASAKSAMKAPAKPIAKAVSPKQSGSTVKPVSGKIVRPVLKPTATKATVKIPAKPPTPTTVTLKHLAAAVAERHDMAKKQADTIVADVFGRVVDHLKAGDRVRIGGLGIIEVKNRLARMGRNPSTGEAIQIKASKKVGFRAAKELKDAI
jgi:DNA-binding protein HU-beta